MSATRLFSHRSVLLGALVLMLLVSGCRRVQNTQPTLQPTATFTPRSTPLPTVATPPPPGDSDNPIDVLFLRPPALSRSAVTSAIADLEIALTASTGLSLNVRTVDTGADAVAALCASADGPAAVAWVDGVTYAAAHAQGCAEPEIMITREDGAAARIVIIVPSSSEAQNASDLTDAHFCRLGVDDLYSWIAPSLLLLSLTQISAIEDYEDVSQLVAAVASGDCDAAGIAQADLDEIGAGSRIRTLQPPINMPYDILIMPPVVPLGAREALNTAFIAAANDETQAALLQPLLGQVAIGRVEADSLRQWDAIVRQTGLDFAAMGQ